MNKAVAQAGACPITVRVLAALFALAGPILALAPRGMAPLLITTAVLATASERFSSGTWPAPPLRAVLLSAAFLAWCALTLLWDLNAQEGARKLLDIILVFAAALSLIGVSKRLGDAQSRGLAAVLGGGVVVALVLLGIETGFDFPLYRVVMGGSNPKLIDLLESKRSVDALPLLVWPAALALERLGRPRLGASLAVIFALASFRLTAASSTLAMMASLAIFGLALWRISVARRLLAVGMVTAFVLVIPLAIAVYDAGGTTGPVLAPLDQQHQFSARHRLEIWHFAAEKALDRPLFGHGLNSSRFVPNDGAVSAFYPGKPVMTLHPHDVFLQVWVELGFVGVVLAGALLLSVLGTIRDWPDAAARYASAGYAAALVIAGLAFGIWQTWWMATLAFGAIACVSVRRRGTVKVSSEPGADSNDQHVLRAAGSDFGRLSVPKFVQNNQENHHIHLT